MFVFNKFAAGSLTAPCLRLTDESHSWNNFLWQKLFKHFQHDHCPVRKLKILWDLISFDLNSYVDIYDASDSDRISFAHCCWPFLFNFWWYDIQMFPRNIFSITNEFDPMELNFFTEIIFKRTAHITWTIWSWCPLIPSHWDQVRTPNLQ